MRNLLLVFLLFISSVAFSQINMTLGLQAYYPFTGTPNDVSGNNNNPAFNNASLTNDAQGNANSAYHFNGSTTYMRIPNSASLNMGNSMSMALKVRATGFYTGPCYNNALVIKGDQDFQWGNYSLRFSDQVTGCTSSASTATEQFAGANTVAGSPFVQLNRWYSVVWTYDGTFARIYVDCVLINTVATSLGSFTNGYDLYFGKMNNAQYPYWLNGDLDEIRIYNRVLNPDEVNFYGQCSAAPVTLMSFNASVVNNKKINLDWKTAAEMNIRSYTVLRSATGNAADFTAIGEVEGQHSNNSNSYAFSDNTAKPNISYYYKLSINEYSGTKQNSETRTAKISNKDFYTVVYPNPTAGVIKVILNNAGEKSVVKVINGLGQVVASQTVEGSNNSPVLVDISKTPRGSYWLSIQSGSEITGEKIIKQ